MSFWMASRAGADVGVVCTWPGAAAAMNMANRMMATDVASERGFIGGSPRGVERDMDDTAGATRLAKRAGVRAYARANGRPAGCPPAARLVWRERLLPR